jgi:esterase/lipase
MELAQLLITPGTLLTAFIFFWKQAKSGRDELKRELKSDMNELKSDVKTSIAELKEEIVSVRSEVTSIRVEMHDMNGRLGRVEGLLKVTHSE